MLDALGLRGIRLLTNNPDKVAQSTALGITVHEVGPTVVRLTAANARCLLAKDERTATTSSSGCVKAR